MEIINCKGLNFTYNTSGYPALKGMDFSVSCGELCLVIGRSAAGKSTLFRLLKKELSPVGKQSGELAVNGRVGFVAQYVDESIVTDRVRSELSFGLTNMGMDRDCIELLVNETASYFNLCDKLDYEISGLSGGERQMVNLASVMIMRPDIIVLDEPTAQLDPISAERFINMIERLHRDFSTTVLISEHSTDKLFDIADSVMLITDGAVERKSDTDSMIDYLLSTEHEMLGTVPVPMRLFEGARTVWDCRERVAAMELTPLSVIKEKCDTALRAKGISFAYEKGTDILSALSLNVYKGRINAILGANSSGKSTLLKVLSGVLRHHHGKLKADGKISMLCQNPFDLFTKEKCCDEVEFGEITDFLEIDDIKAHHPYDLSGGQAQRLALAKILSTGADIILLDEPTKGFDSVLKTKLAELLANLCESGKTILITGHDIEFIGQYSDYVSFLSNGRIVTTADRRSFFSSLNFYTTSVSAITRGIAQGIVSVEDLKESAGL